jgi:ABC-2 type transport system permease protein
MIATLRYEFRMQIHRPVLWIVYGLTYAATVASFGSTYVTLDLGFGEGLTSKTAMVSSASLLMSLLPIVYGCLLADRLIRDRRLGVAGILDAIPAGRTGRLIGKYLGVCAATAVPLMLAYFGRAVAYAITEGEPAALGWAVVVFVAAIVPGLLFLGALALAGPLLMPVMLFRVLFVVYWLGRATGSSRPPPPTPRPSRPSQPSKTATSHSWRPAGNHRNPGSVGRRRAGKDHPDARPGPQGSAR